MNNYKYNINYSKNNFKNLKKDLVKLKKENKILKI
jgi:hypothetical protein